MGSHCCCSPQAGGCELAGCDCRCSLGMQSCTRRMPRCRASVSVTACSENNPVVGALCSAVTRAGMDDCTCFAHRRSLPDGTYIAASSHLPMTALLRHKRTSACLLQGTCHAVLSLRLKQQQRRTGTGTTCRPPMRDTGTPVQPPARIVSCTPAAHTAACPWHRRHMGGAKSVAMLFGIANSSIRRPPPPSASSPPCRR